MAVAEVGPHFVAEAVGAPYLAESFVAAEDETAEPLEPVEQSFAAETLEAGAVKNAVAPQRQG